MLTLKGYRIGKNADTEKLKKQLTIKPYIPSVFVKPQFVQKYPVYDEDSEFLYVPKHFGIEKFGIPKSQRTIVPDSSKKWEFAGKLRDIQLPVVNSFLLPQPHDGIISLHTGGGKTVCALYIVSQLRVPTLILVHNTFLRDQWSERITNFLPKLQIGKIQGDIIDDGDIVVAMLQSVSQKDYPSSTFAKFGLIIVDECHHIASESFSKAIPKLTSQYMLGLSATPERKDKLMYAINWFLGPLLYTSNTADKTDELVAVEVFDFEESRTSEERATPAYQEYNQIIYNNSGVMFTTLMINKLTEYMPRNIFISEIIAGLTDRKILVLTDRIEHTKLLFNMMPEELQKESCILLRSTKPEVRTEWCLKKRILIATYHMCKEGFDVESLNTLVIATPRPDVDQIVGRILRTEKEKRKIHPLIIDVVDPQFRRQFQERLSLYKKRSYNVEMMQLV